MKSNQKWLQSFSQEGKEANDWHFRENLVPWGILSAGPTPWCRAPWRSTNRTCLWPETDWQPAATERGSPPARTGNQDGLMPWIHTSPSRKRQKKTQRYHHTTQERRNLPTLTNKTHWENNTSVKRDRSWAHTLRYRRTQHSIKTHTRVNAAQTKIFQGSSSILVRLSCLQSVSAISVSLMRLNDREI